ncbi:MAG: hypothetical protein ABIF19_11115 [Planctomycetota bacterium]
MARKRIRRILSGGAIVLSVVLFCTMDISVQAFEAEAVTYTIAGSTGVSGATMKGLVNQSGLPVTTDQNGFYSAIVKYGWRGTVTPMKEGYTFEPASKAYENVTMDMTNEDYVPSQLTFTISGRAGMEGVEMSGLPGNPITGAGGTYSVTVEYGWTGMVTPIKEGYKFTPESKTLAPVKSNLTNENYASEVITLLITGSVGVEGVTMNGLTGNPVSRQGGVYSAKVDYNWTGTVTPTKEGYDFEPAAIPYSNIVADQTNQDYLGRVMTFTIAGTAGMAGVEMKGLPGNPFTDQSGYYSTTVEYGFSGTVTPTKAGYKFVPASKIYSPVKSDRTSENYTGETITLTISGRAGMPDVEMNGLPGNPMTGADGSYSVTVDYGWNGTVTPIKEGYTFTPDSKPYPAVTTDMTNQNYTAQKMTYTISGSTLVGGVTLTGVPGKAVTSNTDGSYTATVEHGWTGTVRPAKEGYEFAPATIQYDKVMMSQTNQDYTPTLLQLKITGSIISNQGRPVADVSILADNNGGSTVTNANGEYELQTGYGWNGTVTPMKDGYTFNPPNKRYAAVTREQTNQKFMAVAKMFTITDSVKMGNVPVEGVTVTAIDATGAVDTTVTDSKGSFTVKVPYNWSGDVAISKAGFRFNPPSMPYSNVMTDMERGVQKLPPPPPPTQAPPTQVTPRQAPPTQAPPTQVPPTQTVPGQVPPAQPDVSVPGGPTPPPSVAEEPQTEIEKQIAAMRKQLEEALAQKQAAPVTQGPPVAPGQRLITNQWIDGDLALEVLPAIAQDAGVTIIPDETVVGLVTAKLENVPLDMALEIVLAGTNYVVKRTPYYYLVASAGIADPMFERMSETRRFTMNYITAQAAVGLLATPFKSYAQAEVGAPGVDTYTVVVTAPPEMAERIMEDLKKIDKLPAQILLDARIVVMERGDLLNLGVEWGWPNIQAGVFASDHYNRGTTVFPDFGGKAPWGIQMGYAPDATFTNALQLSLNLLAQNNEATILSKPQVLAQDGKQAQMQVTTEEYYFLQAPSQLGAFYQSSQLETVESGTTLTITPHIGDSNDITLQIAVEVSDSIPRGQGNELPVVTRRKADNVVRIKDGGTVALAGLSENRTRIDKRRAPGLSNLPLIGDLFKNSNDQNSSREIAVFVTARIVPQNYKQQARMPETPASMSGMGMTPGMPAPSLPQGQDFKSALRQSMSRQTR